MTKLEKNVIVAARELVGAQSEMAAAMAKRKVVGGKLESLIHAERRMVVAHDKLRLAMQALDDEEMKLRASTPPMW